MKKPIILLSILSLVMCGCTNGASIAQEQDDDTLIISDEKYAERFSDLNDDKLLNYLEDSIYSEVSAHLSTDDYVVEGVDATFYTKEYIEELAANSQNNVYFGYTLDQLNDIFKGKKYVFDLDDNNETTVKLLEEYSDDTFPTIMKNVAIGTGVIVICVTVSCATAGTAPAISAIFAASASTASTMAIKGSAIGAIASGIIKYYETGDLDETLEAALIGASEGFKFGAISGAISGGAKEATKWMTNGSFKNTQAWQVAEKRALEKYGGSNQISYLNGNEVAYGTNGATRPDIVRNIDGVLEGIEVKCYDLSTKTNVDNMIKTLLVEIPSRMINMPKGSTQRIALDVTGKGFSRELVFEVVEKIKYALRDIYPNIPIDVIGL